MYNLHLIKEENGVTYPTYGLMLLLGLHEHVETKCSRFKGTTMSVFVDRKEYTGDMFDQLEQTEVFIKNHLHLGAEIKGLQHIDILEIPEKAIREALVNAYVHRDYSNFGRDIKVGIYDDILNIVSPGGLPNGLTEQDLTQGRSEIRNRVIARVFKELGFIEQWGSGISRIIDLCTKQGLEAPVIREKNDFVDWEFMRSSYQDNTGGEINEGINEGINIPENHQNVLNAIEEFPTYSAAKIADHLSISVATVERSLSWLKAQNIIERVGAKKTGHWKRIKR